MNSNYLSLGPGEIYIDGQPFGQVKSITTFSKDEVTSEQWDNILSLFGDGNTNYTQVSFSAQPEIQENFFNIPLTLLPKHYPCKTLIISIAANQPYEYQSIDISQLEEKGIAHFVVGRTIGFQEIEEEYKREKAMLQEEENEDGIEWLREGAETGLCSTIYGPADLYYYEELGYWDFE